MHSGHEKTRHITGGAYSVDNKGNSVSVNLDSIYELAAQKMGVSVNSIAKCEYEDIKPAAPSAEMSNG